MSPGFGTALRVLNGVQAVGGTLNAVENLAEGNYLAGTLDALGVVGNLLQIARPCFPGDVQVLTRRGWVRWDGLTPADEVLSLPEMEPEGELAYRPVEEVFQRWGVIWEVTVGGQVLRTTAEHPFWVDSKGWTAAKDLQAGDRLRSHDGRWLAVEGVRNTGREEVVYNCRVAEYHTYFVGDAAWDFSVWAHNSYNAPTGNGGLATTAHGAERLADPARTLCQAEIAAARRAHTLRQADGATVYIHQVEPGKFNVVIEGERGIVTTFRHLDTDAVRRLAVNYGWTGK